MIALWLAMGGLSASAAAPDLCPIGKDWTRERQQRPPIVEPAPVLSRAVECAEQPVPPSKRGWIVEDACTLICSYADGEEARVSLVGVTHLSTDGRPR